MDYFAQNDVWSGDYRFAVVTAQADGDRYAIEWEMVGTNTGALAGIPPTGKPYRIRGASVGQRDAEGRIVLNPDCANLADHLARSVCSPRLRNAGAGRETALLLAYRSGRAHV